MTGEITEIFGASAVGKTQVRSILTVIHVWESVPQQ